MFTVALPASVQALVLLLAFRVPMLYDNIDTVPALPALSNTAVSCARGKLLTAGDPPLLVAHAVADQSCVPARFQYTVLAVGKVMPALLPQSPSRVPEAQLAVPVELMSRKSMSVSPVTVAADSVL